MTAGQPHAVRVRDADCEPLKDAVVDVWHCDAGGVYSGFGNATSNRTFMRGLQRTNAKGVAVFRTVYPGWYPGRTVHIHVKVHVKGNVVHTGQLFFPAATSQAVYARAPYNAHGSTPDTSNAQDSIYRNGGKRSQVKVRKNAGLYVASITMGVTR